MKIAFWILVVTSFACLSEATLKHLKAKLKLSPFTQPAPRYVTSPVVLSEPLPVVHPSPVSIFSSHITTYSTVPHYSPSYAVYKSSVYPPPAVYKSVIAVPVPVYEEPVALSVEASAFDEGRYSPYAEIWDK